MNMDDPFNFFRGPTPRQHPTNLDGLPTDRWNWESMVDDSSRLQALLQRTADWTTFPALLQDCFHTYFKHAPQLRPLDAVDLPHRANRPWIETLLGDEQTTALRKYTVLDSLTSAYAAAVTGEALADQLEAHPEWVQATPADGTSAPGMGQAVQQALSQAQQQVQDLHHTLATLGPGLAEAVLGQGSVGARLDQAQQLLNPRFRRLMDLLGQLTHLASSHTARLQHEAATQLAGITQGDQWSKLLPSERHLLAQPHLRAEFFRRWSERQLLQYAYQPPKTHFRGPMCVLIDASSSMDGDRFDWASATTLALLEIARAQHRDLALAVFNAGVQFTATCPGGCWDPELFWKLAGLRAKGGTRYEPAIDWALAQTGAWRDADLLLITDGECQLDADRQTTLRQARQTRGMDVHTVIIGHDTVPDSVTGWSTHTWCLRDLTVAAAQPIFDAMSRPPAA